LYNALKETCETSLPRIAKKQSCERKQALAIAQNSAHHSAKEQLVRRNAAILAAMTTDRASNEI